MSDTVESLIAYCQDGGRVCPMPQQWNKLWGMLPGRVRDGVGWQPPAPLILAAWHETPALMKMVRLADHIKWADQHDTLEPVAEFLRNLREEDWHHLSE